MFPSPKLLNKFLTDFLASILKLKMKSKEKVNESKKNKCIYIKKFNQNNLYYIYLSHY